MRFPDEPIALIGFRKHVMETREPLSVADSTPELAERYGNPYVLAGEPIKSGLFVPLVVGGDAPRASSRFRTLTGRTRSATRTSGS